MQIWVHLSTFFIIKILNLNYFISSRITPVKKGGMNIEAFAFLSASQLRLKARVNPLKTDIFSGNLRSIIVSWDAVGAFGF